MLVIEVGDVYRSMCLLLCYRREGGSRGGGP